MKPLTHGGDWAGYRAEFGRDPLDFSANVSPLGLPEGVAKAITAALATADRYPDPLCRALRENWRWLRECPPNGCCAATARQTSSSGWRWLQSPALHW